MWPIPAISLITSTYRAASFLPQYTHHVASLGRALHTAGIALEIVVVANDAQPEERALLEKLPVEASSLDIQLLFVPREPIYASWNRGVEQAGGDILGFWNVDDVRYPDALITAYKIFTEQQAELVDCGFALQQGSTIRHLPAPYSPFSLSPKSGVGPFFLFHRNVYRKAGGFNPNFRITGDYEWSKRPVVRQALYRSMKIEGGLFTLHGDNLSGGTSPLEWVEFNIALIWHGGLEHLRPVDPILMRETWESWGHQGGYMPDDVARWLWGNGAQQRYDAYHRERNSRPFFRRLRLALARRGLWHSVEWEVIQWQRQKRQTV